MCTSTWIFVNNIEHGEVGIYSGSGTCNECQQHSRLLELDGLGLGVCLASKAWYVEVRRDGEGKEFRRPQHN